MLRLASRPLALVAAAVAVVAMGVLDGLLAGIAISVAMTLRGLSEPRMSEPGRHGGGATIWACSTTMCVPSRAC